MVTILEAQREKHLRLRAGVGENAKVSLAAIRLPPEALIFPSPPREGRFDFTALRNPKTMTREIRERFR